MTASVNGTQIGQDTLASMAFSCREGRDAHPPLGAGDTVTVTVDRLGTLMSRIVDGNPA